jgi:hypothetical protein
MTDRKLIVARLQPEGATQVAKLFAESDRTDLPNALGVVRRHLFQYQDLYFQYVEFDGDADEAMVRARPRPDFIALCDDLAPHVTPYDPRTWQSPADAMATQFYSWTRQDNGGTARP